MKQATKTKWDTGRLRTGRGPDFKKRQAILDAAYKSFLTYGLDISVDAIAKNAGVSKQTIYNAFPTKHDLFVASATHHAQTITENLKRMTENEIEPRAILTKIAEQYCYIALDPAFLSVLRKLLASDDMTETARSAFNTSPEVVINQLAYYLEQASFAGKLYVKNAFLSAEFFFGSLRGYVRERYWLKSIPPPAGKELPARVDYAVDLFLAAHK
jgi:TetR/AcrR family transcriptional repressor of mexJK operon